MVCLTTKVVSRFALGAALLTAASSCANNLKPQKPAVANCIPVKPPVTLFQSSGKSCDWLFEANYVSILERNATVCGIDLPAETKITRLSISGLKIDSHLSVWAAFLKNDMEVGGIWYKGEHGIAFVNDLVLNGVLAKPAQLAGPDGEKHRFYPGDAINFGVYKSDSWEASTKFSTYLISAMTRERVNF